MELIPKSGYTIANTFARSALEAFENVMGKNGLNAILHLAGLSNLIDQSPADDLQRGFDFADFSALNAALEELYGFRGGRGLALQAGRATFNKRLKSFGALAGVGDPAFKGLPLQAKTRIGLPTAARMLSHLTDQQSTVAEVKEAYLWRIHRCPICWMRKGAEKPVCYFSTGLLHGLLTWVSGGLDFRIDESKCCAVGDDVCEFVIQKIPIS
jgi:hypothetical protein